VFNITVHNISAIYLRLVLLVVVIVLPAENRLPASHHCQTFKYNITGTPCRDLKSNVQLVS